MKYMLLMLLCIFCLVAAMQPSDTSVNGHSFYNLCKWVQRKFSQKDEAEHNTQHHPLQTAYNPHPSSTVRVYQQGSEIIVVAPPDYSVRHISPLQTKNGTVFSENGIVFFPPYHEGDDTDQEE